MLENMFEKLYTKKKVDNGLIPIFLLFLDRPRSYITVNLIFYAPNVANLGFLKVVLTIAL